MLEEIRDGSRKQPPGSDPANTREAQALGELKGGFGNFIHRNNPDSLKFCSVGAARWLARICSVLELKHLVWKVLLCSNSGADK